MTLQELLGVIQTVLAQKRLTWSGSLEGEKKTLPKVPAPKKWSDVDLKRLMQKFLEEVEVWFEATHIKGARRVKTLPTLLESTALEWFLAEKAKTPKGVENAKIWEEMKKMLLARFVPKHQHFLDGIALIHLKQGGGKGSFKNYAWEFRPKWFLARRLMNTPSL